MSKQNGHASFHMVQCQFDPRGLVQLGRMLKLPLARTDIGYLVHCALGELFGEEAPKPFFVDDDPRSAKDTAERNRHLRVLGYADSKSDALHEEAKLCPNPAVYDICDWDRFCSKDMPQTFREGRRLGFELRACPVVRKSSAGTGENFAGDEVSWRKGQELDAFLSKAWQSDADEKLDREAVYRDWLARQFDQRGGATVKSDGVSVERFSIERVVRRHGRTRDTQHFQIPDVTLTGTLKVTDGHAFAALLKSGLGRHKSFGYGMLKVRRA